MVEVRGHTSPVYAQQEIWDLATDLLSSRRSPAEVDIDISKKLEMNRLHVAPYERGVMYLREIRELKQALERDCRDDKNAWVDLTKKLERFKDRVCAHRMIMPVNSSCKSCIPFHQS